MYRKLIAKIAKAIDMEIHPTVNADWLVQTVQELHALATVPLLIALLLVNS